MFIFRLRVEHAWFHIQGSVVLIQPNSQSFCEKKSSQIELFFLVSSAHIVRVRVAKDMQPWCNARFVIEVLYVYPDQQTCIRGQNHLKSCFLCLRA